MSDVVVTVPKAVWSDWLAEGELPGQTEWRCFFCDGTGGCNGVCVAKCDAGVGRPGLTEWDFYMGGHAPVICRGERVYVVAHGRLRGFAPLVRIDYPEVRRFSLVRGGNAQAVTIDEPIRGFQGWRYRWWETTAERPFPDFATECVR